MSADQEHDGRARRDPSLAEKVDREWTGAHGTVMSDASLEDEEHPEINPQSYGELGRKIRAEASEGSGVVDRAKRVMKELDRDVSGEYERREDPDAPDPRGHDRT